MERQNVRLTVFQRMRAISERTETVNDPEEHTNRHQYEERRRYVFCRLRLQDFNGLRNRAASRQGSRYQANKYGRIHHFSAYYHMVEIVYCTPSAKIISR